MALSGRDYAADARNAGLNVYWVAEGDREGDIRLYAVTPANPCCNCYSVAKAFTVTAVGLLYDRGLMTPETRVAEVLADLLPADADPNWQRVTAGHLMLHTAGFGRGLLDIDADDASLYPTDDYLKIVFSEPLAYAPGERFQYTDAAYYLLSRMVERVAGQKLSDLVRRELAVKMHFREFAWSECPQGHSMGATGLYLHTKDMVKLGILYLNRGVWEGERILSEEWIELVLERGYEFTLHAGGWYAKGGMRGQMLAFHPDRGLAVAWHSFERKNIMEVLLGE